MRFGKIISLAALVCFGLAALVGSTGCANIVPPMGGPRDSLPPLLVKATPGDSTRNFKGNKIVFTFDEFVDVQAAQQNLNMSPLPRNIPSVDFRLNTVTVKLKDTLEPNTTYSLNFGDAIRDFNEGNILKQFTYTFSTGPYIDSLELSGKVILAETGKVDSTLTVMLHTDPHDSAVVNQRPRYTAKLNRDGSFEFKNLPPKTFYIYALKDEGGMLRYFSEKQLFAFADRPINLQGNTDSVLLYAYSAKFDVKNTIPVASAGAGKNNNRNNNPDRRLRYTTSLVESHQDILSAFWLSFDQPLRVFDSSKIRLYTDSVYNPVTAYSFRKDSTHRKIVLTHDWKENTSYHIILEKDFAEDSTGKKLLKTDTLSFTTKKLADYGSLKIRFRNLDMSKNPVLYFVAGENIQRSVPLAGPEFNQAVFLPGDYELRILYDLDKNGAWTPGDFFGKHRQPELVKPVDRRINVKANWQNDFEIAL